MHDLYKGQAQDFCASCFVDLVEHGHIVDVAGVAFPSIDTALKVVRMEFVDWCRSNGLKAPNVEMSMRAFGRTAQTVYPELGSSYKAGHIKVVIGYLAHLTETLALTDWRSKVRSTACYALADFLHVLDKGGRRLTADEIVRGRRSGFLYLRSYQLLAGMALDAHECLYKLRPKYHYLYHHVDDLKDAWNPRFRHLFMDETWMGLVSRLGKGTHRKTMSLRSLQRYILYISNKWEKRRRLGRFVNHGWR